MSRKVDPDRAERQEIIEQSHQYSVRKTLPDA